MAFARRLPASRLSKAPLKASNIHHPQSACVLRDPLVIANPGSALPPAVATCVISHLMGICPVLRIMHGWNLYGIFGWELNGLDTTKCDIRWPRHSRR